MALRTLLFIAGMAAFHSMPALPPAYVGIILLLCILIVVQKPKTRLAAALFIGFAWAWLHAAHRLDDRLDPSLDGEKLAMRGCIVSLPQKRGYGWRFDFAPLDGNLPGRLRLSSYQSEMVFRAGECWQLTAKLRLPRGTQNPGVSDYETRLFRDGIGATGYVIKHVDNRRYTIDGCCVLLRLRGRIATKIERLIDSGGGLSVKTAAIIRGLAIGDRSRLTADQRNVFAATATGHLMAISGLHVGLAAWLGFIPGYVCWWLWPCKKGRLARQSVMLVTGFLSAVLYAAMSGFAIPTRRALAMLAVYVGARFSARRVFPAQGLALAAVMVNILDPFALLAPGFWMSFCAVGAILFGLHGVKGRLSQFITIQWSVFVGLMPVTTLVFGKLVIASPVINAIVVPYFSIMVIPAALVGSMATLVSPALADMLLGISAKATDFVWPLLQLMAAGPYLIIATSSIWIVIAMIAVTTIVLARSTGFQSWLLIPLIMVCMAGKGANIPHGEVRMDVLDVGQGLAIIVRTRRHVLVYDAGPAWHAGFDSGSMIVAPFLNYLGFKSADMLVVSHSDMDHSGGVASLINRIDVSKILVSDMQGLKRGTPQLTKAKFCERGLMWNWDGVSFTVVHPDKQTHRTVNRGNNDSCVIRISTGAHAILLPGDIESATEQYLTQNGRLLAADIVVVPHHGSATSSTAPFVRATGARYALVSNGWHNRWGFPKEAVIERWSRHGGVVLTTARHGCLSFAMDTAGIRYGPNGHRDKRRHYWSAADVNH